MLNVLIPAAVGLMTASSQRKAARREADLARQEREEQQAILEKQKQEYRNIQFTNPYAGMQNQFAENVFEDLTVNQQQAQFQAQQGAQQRANIMAGLRGAAGTSGIAGLAQALANQGQLQAQQISADIGKQEAMNERLRAQGALQVQKGAAAVDLQTRAGEAMVQQAESGRQATLLGMQQSQAAGANLSYQQQLANQKAANQSASEMQTKALSGLFGSDDFKDFTGSGFGNLGNDLYNITGGGRTKIGGGTITNTGY